MRVFVTGASRWPAVHPLDLGRLYRLALDKAPAGTQLIAAAEEGIPVRDIAGVIGRHLGIPVVSIPADKAMQHFATERFGAFGAIMTMGLPPVSSTSTRQLLGWAPSLSTRGLGGGVSLRAGDPRRPRVPARQTMLSDY